MITYCDDEGNDLDIDVKDFVWGLSTYETEELLEELVSQMKTSALSNVLKKAKNNRQLLTSIIRNTGVTFVESMHNENLSKINENYIRLTNEDIETIAKIADKF